MTLNRTYPAILSSACIQGSYGSNRVRSSEARPRPEEPHSRRFHWEDRDTLAVITTDRWTPGRSERTDCDKRPAPRALHYEPRGPVIRAPVQFQPGSMPAFLIARTASGEVRNFRSAVAPAGFLAWLCTPPENTVISCISSDRGPR